jgi:hypothetical protein
MAAAIVKVFSKKISFVIALSVKATRTAALQEEEVSLEERHQHRLSY